MKLSASNSSSKSELRQQLRAMRRALPEAERARLSQAVCEQLLSCPWWDHCQNVALYASFDGEVETAVLQRELHSRGVRTLYPRTKRTERQLEFVAVQDVAALQPMGWSGLCEPRAGAGEETLVDAALIDVFVVPGLGFDRRGGRLGYGVGFYDRALAAPTGLRVGLAYEFQLLDSLAIEMHDVLMDFVVTDTQLVTTRARNIELSKS